MPFPIHPDKHRWPALLTAERMIAFRRGQGLTAAPPEAVILCLYKGAMRYFGFKHRAQKVSAFLGDLYLLEQRGRRVGVLGNFGIGSSVVASLADELGAWGVQRIVLFSLAGGLRSDLLAGSVVIADRALRDEGASYHYLPPERYVNGSPALARQLAESLARRSMPPHLGAVWSTDAPYRETRAEVEQFQSEGVLAVDMESAGLFAVGQARGLETGAVLVVGDSLAGPDWTAPPDMRALHLKLKQVLNVLMAEL
jgi:uridine phosphorylase